MPAPIPFTPLLLWPSGRLCSYFLHCSLVQIPLRIPATRSGAFGTDGEWWITSQGPGWIRKADGCEGLAVERGGRQRPASGDKCHLYHCLNSDWQTTFALHPPGRFQSAPPGPYRGRGKEPGAGSMADTEAGECGMCMMGRAAGEVVTGLREEGHWVDICLSPRSHVNAPENARGDAQVRGMGERRWRLIPG